MSVAGVLIKAPLQLSLAVLTVFHEFGEIVEVVILRDRRTSMHQVRCCQMSAQSRPKSIDSAHSLNATMSLVQGCCFVKYSNLIAAQSAINALHNQRSLPPLRNPLQARGTSRTYWLNSLNILTMVLQHSCTSTLTLFAIGSVPHRIPSRGLNEFARTIPCLDAGPVC